MKYRKTLRCLLWLLLTLSLLFLSWLALERPSFTPRMALYAAQKAAMLEPGTYMTMLSQHQGAHYSPHGLAATRTDSHLRLFALYRKGSRPLWTASLQAAVPLEGPVIVAPLPDLMAYPPPHTNRLDHGLVVWCADPRAAACTAEVMVDGVCYALTPSLSKDGLFLLPLLSMIDTPHKGHHTAFWALRASLASAAPVARPLDITLTAAIYDAQGNLLHTCEKTYPATEVTP